ncbi:Nin one binding Zn-ribbon like-domain-containing protein [Blyttiomyces helicus]|uniref:20S-pre-rRNA D-site endonuclease NOB1 n=1 Tax=Blyttiomyces helicus TaxID=388810 RepID=A0A4V1IR51_9FUNG|nr:Nin one binding Zn-ribbon like-domain-containing protein [Blyttiomyces helicus]|eukprot:RKO88837.1 Nin one binding Zn-ribbon like-domain-containing protein [Blyttiomyces helicus]
MATEGTLPPPDSTAPKMSSASRGKDTVHTLVVDAAPLIKATPIAHLATRFITTPDVMREIRDRQARANLAALPFELEVRAPSEDAMAAVVAFAKKTGDFAALSAADLKVIALTYMLEKETTGIAHLRTEPIRANASVGGRREKKPAAAASTEGASVVAAPEQPEQEAAVERSGDPALTPSEDTEAALEQEADIEIGEWITPQNVAKYKARDSGAGSAAPREPRIIPVACITSDFAMQNVIMQMNLRLLSVDGLMIKKLKSWILRCHACFKTTADMEKKFCPYCGNNTLMRTSFSVPTPKGGRKGNDMILREDQREYQKALAATRRKKTTLDPFDLDYVGLDGKRSSGTEPVIGHGRRNVNIDRKPRRR